MATGAVATKGLRELVRAFNKMEKDLANDLVMELEEAADPVRVVTEQKVGQMRGVAQGRDSSYWSAMRIGVARSQGLVYVAPEWRSNKGTPQGAVFSRAIRRRMEQAVSDKSDEIEKRLGHFLDTLADEWGSHLAA